MAHSPRILTTVVGSYPIPDWLVTAPSDQALRDATRLVIDTQERAGIDIVCDGELYRFDINHPESNGMIDYFIRPMAGVRKQLRFEEVIDFRRRADMQWRRLPAGVVEGPLDSGSLDLPDACQRARAIATKTLKFTLTGPHMLAKTLEDQHYRSVPALTNAIAAVLAKQVRHIDAEIIQVDEANLPGHPEEWPWALEAMNQVLDAVKTKALKAAVDAMNFDGKTLYVESEPSDALILSSRNIPGFRVMEPSHLTVYDILNCKTLAVTTAALSRLEERLSR